MLGVARVRGMAIFLPFFFHTSNSSLPLAYDVEDRDEARERITFGSIRQQSHPIPSNKNMVLRLDLCSLV